MRRRAATFALVMGIATIGAPTASAALWDGVTPANGVEFSPSHD
jgi:hypothetical protein